MSSFHTSCGARLAQGTSGAATRTVTTPFAATPQAATPAANTQAEAPAGTQVQQPAQTMAEPERTRSGGGRDAKPEQKPEPQALKPEQKPEAQAAAVPVPPHADSSNPPASIQVRWPGSSRLAAACAEPCGQPRAVPASSLSAATAAQQVPQHLWPLLQPFAVCFAGPLKATQQLSLLCAYMSF